MFNPISTYRIQFSRNFTFKNLEDVVLYFEDLGIGTIYASPILKATPGSAHCYDVIDPHSINPDIGTIFEFKELVTRLKSSNIGWLQDIVPNHMAFNGHNRWLMDILEKGEKSFYYKFFDIEWNSHVHTGKLMTPFLGASLEEILNNNELIIEFSDGRFVIKYYDNFYYLSFPSYITVINFFNEEKPEELKNICEELTLLAYAEDITYLNHTFERIRQELQSHYTDNDKIRNHIDNSLGCINNDPEKLKKILDEQYFVLTLWKETEEKINYRRFFTVNDLICLRMQDEKIFSHYHQLIISLVFENFIDGLRVDHIDGILDPAFYLKKLFDITGQNLYIIVEKILERDEELCLAWDIQGSTGYDFLSMANNLLTFEKNSVFFTDFYNGLIGDNTEFSEVLYQKKKFILRKRMAGELDNLFHLFVNSEFFSKREIENIGEDKIKNAIAEFLLCCPVYRFYGDILPFPDDEAKKIRAVLSGAKKKIPELKDTLPILRKLFLSKNYPDDEYRKKAQYFYLRCMQLTGPLMAKGLEDTSMYVYNRFIAHNEVGDSPAYFGYSREIFHKKMLLRQQKWSLSLNTTTTHDTKRGEDIRARLNVLSELAFEWSQKVWEWLNLNRDLRERIENTAVPNINDEYLLYQTIIGALYFGEEITNIFIQRIKDYMVKALREAKEFTSWSEPDFEYESKTLLFVEKILNKETSFWKSFLPFQQKVAEFGIINSLSQVFLKLTCPGIPDIYQGCEMWDFRLVDPDNRTPVDFSLRKAYLDEIIAYNQTNSSDFFKKLWDERRTGKIKLWLTWLILNERKLNAEVFLKGEYIPLMPKGNFKGHVFSFAIKYDKNWYIIAFPIYYALLYKKQNLSHINEKINWKNTSVVLLSKAPLKLQNLLDGTDYMLNGQMSLNISEFKNTMGFIFLKGREED